MTRTIARLLACLLALVTAMNGISIAFADQQPGETAAAQVQTLLALPVVAAARDANLAGIQAAGGETLTAGEALAALANFPTLVAEAQPTTPDEQAALAQLNALLANPEFQARVAAVTSGLQTMNPDDVISTDQIIVYTFQVLANLPHISVNTGFWGGVVGVLATAAAGVVAGIACTVTAPFCIVGAAGLAVTAVAGYVLATDTNIEGDVKATASCPYDNVCEVSNIRATNTNGHTLTRFDVIFGTVVTSGPVGAHGVAYCSPSGGQSPVTGSAITNCFTRLDASTLGYVYEPKAYNKQWFTQFPGSASDPSSAYYKFTCAARVEVRVQATWSNGKHAVVDLLMNKTARAC